MKKIEVKTEEQLPIYIRSGKKLGFNFWIKVQKGMKGYEMDFSHEKNSTESPE
jgi:hypothetical protein